MLWHLAFILFGIVALLEDATIQNDHCGNLMHVWKYAILNVGFAFLGLITYLLFPAGGEGARARAVSMAIFHITFTVWMYLMWRALPARCDEVLQAKYGTILIWLLVSFVHNSIGSLFFVVHEVYLGPYLEYDLTLLAEVRVRKFISDDSNAFPMPEPDKIQNFKDQLKDKLEADDITILPDEANQSDSAPPAPQVKFPAPHVRFPAPAT